MCVKYDTLGPRRINQPQTHQRKKFLLKNMFNTKKPNDRPYLLSINIIQIFPNSTCLFHKIISFIYDCDSK